MFDWNLIFDFFDIRHGEHVYSFLDKFLYFFNVRLPVYIALLFVAVIYCAGNLGEIPADILEVFADIRFDHPHCVEYIGIFFLKRDGRGRARLYGTARKQALDAAAVTDGAGDHVSFKMGCKRIVVAENSLEAVTARTFKIERYHGTPFDTIVTLPPLTI